MNPPTIPSAARLGPSAARLGPSAVLLGVLCCGTPACSQRAADAAWPAGTVLVVDDRPILAEDVDRVAGWISSVEPLATPLHLRRLALTNVVFPCLAARSLSGGGWRAAFEAATRTRAALGDPLDGPPDNPDEPGPGETLQGSWQELGLESFGAALEAGPGRWSTVIESPGVFRLVRLEGASEDGLRLTVRRVDFPYLTKAALDLGLEAALDASRLRVVDETWRDTVPLAWLHRMKEGSS